MHKEMACPTGLLYKIVHSSIQNQHDDLKSIVSEIMGNKVKEQDIHFCFMNVIDMCFGVIHYVHHGMMLKGKRNFKKIISEKDIEVYADHIVRFALAGIRSIRNMSIKKTVKQKEISKNQKARIRSKQ